MKFIHDNLAPFIWALNMIAIAGLLRHFFEPGRDVECLNEPSCVTIAGKRPLPPLASAINPWGGLAPEPDETHSGGYVGPGIIISD